MHRKLLLAAFEKASENQKKQGVLTPSTNSSAKLLSDFIEEASKFPFTSRSLRDYYNKAVKAPDTEIKIKQLKVVQALCAYLGYEDYEDFVLKNSKQKTKIDDGGVLLLAPEKASAQEENPSNKHQRTSEESLLKKSGSNLKKTMIVKIGIAVLLLSLSVISIVMYMNRECWMVWEVDRYVETEFDAKLLQNGALKLCNEDRFKNFRQVEVNCETSFFKDDKGVKIWYGKNTKGKLEYFTDLGLHPQTGKTLKPITQYMIAKHICKK
ncbi:hypothetical protein [Ulvibacter litoralis]|uniref:Uncharacterized protein n=1 Tax=Ulvibacter litoralis TaxID=227084 RepID=A0A1G7C9V1_9FLAO|nr:hypothetical protein [Ulvibacter litoralis]GHC48112.1 hypothetical protein GCM10008083_09260 [Ulvibacter litoralis]SDE36099.1 hypothetical protein SAMN05421855_101265 [Ulvibacter litoralis]